MSLDYSVCPECGHDQFSAVLTTRTKYTYSIVERLGLYELTAEVVDAGDLGDIDSLTCEDCGHELSEDEAVSVTDYNGDPI